MAFTSTQVTTVLLFECGDLQQGAWNCRYQNINNCIPSHGVFEVRECPICRQSARNRTARCRVRGYPSRTRRVSAYHVFSKAIGERAFSATRWIDTFAPAAAALFPLPFIVKSFPERMASRAPSARITTQSVTGRSLTAADLILVRPQHTTS